MNQARVSRARKALGEDRLAPRLAGGAGRRIG